MTSQALLSLIVTTQAAQPAGILLELALGGATLLFLAALTAWEAALRQITRLRVKQLAEDGVDPAPYERWLGQPTRYLRTLLIWSTLCHVVLILILLLIVRAHLPAWTLSAQLWMTGVAGFFVLLLGKVLPRNWGRSRANQLTPGAVFWTDKLALLATIVPVLPLMDWLTPVLLRLLRTQPAPDIPDLTEDEVRLFLDVSQKEGVLEEEEREMLASVVEFRDTLVKEIMTPRIEFFALEVGSTLQETLDLVVESGHSRFPIYESNLDNVRGVLYAKDLFSWYRRSEPDNGFTLVDLMRQAIFVPETKNISELLSQLRVARTHMAIVVDEYGGTAGLVTIEDILEEIVGEIEDEYDEEEPLYVEEEHGSILADARIEIYRLQEELDIELPDVNDEYDYETLGGFLSAQLGAVPAVGEITQHNGFRMTVVDADERKVKSVRIERITADDATESQSNGNGTASGA